MKKKIFFFLAAVTLLLAFKKLNDVLADVGATIKEVKSQTVVGIAKGYFSVPWFTTQIRESCKKLQPGVREATMMSLGKIIRDYVESPEFQKDYVAFLEKPEPGFSRRGGRGSMPMKTEEQFAEEKKKAVQQLVASMSSDDIVKMYGETLDVRMENASNMLRMLKESPNLNLGKTKEEYQKELEDFKTLKSLYTTDKEAFKQKYAEVAVDEQQKQQMANQKEEIEKQKKRDAEQKEEEAERQKKIAQLKDYKSVIKKELQEFLTVSSNVDYNAKLVEKNGKMVFANPAYEAKSGTWKFCFRCGKEAVTGARKFAQDWLASMK